MVALVRKISLICDCNLLSNHDFRCGVGCDQRTGIPPKPQFEPQFVHGRNVEEPQSGSVSVSLAAMRITNCDCVGADLASTSVISQSDLLQVSFSLPAGCIYPRQAELS